MAAYTAVDNSEAYTDNSFSFQPDFIWLKNRDTTYPHHLFDSVRGADKGLSTNSEDEEQDRGSGYLTSFDSDGFTTGTSIASDTSDGVVAWCWKAGTSFSNDASATSIGDIDSTGSISTAAGISIMSYTGNGTANQSVAHGLGVVPKFIIIKNRSTSGYWPCTNPRFVSVSDPNVMYLQFNEAEADDTNINGTTAPSSTVFGIDDYGAVNTSGDAHIAYCFAEIKGYSKFSTYTGNGDADDGPFVYLGFRPAWVLIKRADSAGSFEIYDAKREGFNPQVHGLYTNSTSAEDNTDDLLDLLSNGFKLYHDGAGLNADGGTYIYMAFAESPFVNSKGVPNKAR